MSNSLWVLTEEYNLYDQLGDYFVAAWAEKPTIAQLEDVCKEGTKAAQHVSNGGGRVKYEDHWYNLKEYKLDASGIFKEVT